MTFIRNPKDFWAGLVYIAFGVAAILIALKYPVGSAGRMGPGYFPRAPRHDPDRARARS